jgi:hypothetical protein
MPGRSEGKDSIKQRGCQKHLEIQKPGPSGRTWFLKRRDIVWAHASPVRRHLPARAKWARSLAGLASDFLRAVEDKGAPKERCYRRRKEGG